MYFLFLTFHNNISSILLYYKNVYIHVKNVLIDFMLSVRLLVSSRLYYLSFCIKSYMWIFSFTEGLCPSPHTVKRSTVHRYLHFFLSIHTFSLEVIYGFNLPYSNCQCLYSSVSGSLLSKIRVT